MDGVNETMEPFPFDDLVDYWQADAGDIEISTADDLYCNPNDALPNVNDVALPPSMAATTRTSYEKIPTRDSRSYVNAIGWQHPFQGIQNHSVPEGHALWQGQLSQDSNSDECSEGSSWDIEWPWLTHDTRTDSFDSLCETGSTFPQPACEATNMEDESMQVSQTKQRRDSDRSQKSSLESIRARNRAAASKCRAKQKKKNQVLHETFEKASSRNAYLKHQTQHLRRVVASLKNFALQHNSGSCRCTTVHSFNKLGAKRFLGQ